MRKSENGLQIFCPLRKKWFINTPEEWVRQHATQFIHKSFGYPLNNLVAEYPVNINQSNQRADILVYKNAKPLILCECKEPRVEIDQKTLDQAMRYAQVLKTNYIYLTNGTQHVFIHIDFNKQKIEFIEELPHY